MHTVRKPDRDTLKKLSVPTVLTLLFLLSVVAVLANHWSPDGLPEWFSNLVVLAMFVAPGAAGTLTLLRSASTIRQIKFRRIHPAKQTETIVYLALALGLVAIFWTLLMSLLTVDVAWLHIVSEPRLS